MINSKIMVWNFNDEDQQTGWCPINFPQSLPLCYFKELTGTQKNHKAVRLACGFGVHVPRRSDKI